MSRVPLSIANLAIRADAKGSEPADRSEPIYGGYTNPRGEIFLFGKDGVYRADLKNQVLHRRAPLNPEAQTRYDATEAGEPFVYGRKTFHRLTREQIVGMCACHRFRLTGHYRSAEIKPTG